MQTAARAATRWRHSLEAITQVDPERERRLASGGIGRPINDITVTWLTSRDGDRCYLCGDKPHRYHVDHVIPKARGGTDDFANLALACPTCNIRKSASIIAFSVRDRMPIYYLMA